MQKVTTGARRSLSRRRTVTGWIVVLPAVVVVVAFLWVPLMRTVYYSFTDWQGRDAEFVGLKNYEGLLTSMLLPQALLTNLIMLIAVALLVLLPALIAMLVSRMKRFVGLARTLLFIPAALSWVVIGLVGRAVFGDAGVVNAMLRALGGDAWGVDWLSRPGPAIAALILLVVWSLFGVNFLVYLGAFGSMDDRVLEAARIDGAGEVRIAVQIVAPMIGHHIRLVTVWSTAAVFGSLFALIYVFSGGGPVGATTTVEYLVYSLGFSDGDFARAAAAGVVLLILIVVVNGQQLWKFAQHDSENG